MVVLGIIWILLIIGQLVLGSLMYAVWVPTLPVTLVPQVALAVLLHIANLEPKLKWNDMFKSPQNQPTLLGVKGKLDPFPAPLLILIVMWVSSMVYFLLAIYFENITPKPFGLRQPWYYPLLPGTWCTPKNKGGGGGSEIRRNSLRDEGNLSFEEEPHGLVGVCFLKLKKSFGKLKVAVDGVTLNLYEGQISALLGHNGAGKSTTLGILTGMIAPTSGTVIVNGHDISSDPDGARQDMGFCPQENMLFDSFTVENHLKFVGKLKGHKGQGIAEEVDRLLTQLNFMDKKKTTAKKLSGGQKRKLQLAMALMGQPKVIVLDEPTSGMDPETSRLVWDLLLRMREGKTIILTTHYMQEADILGDRIAIMAGGRVKCAGSSLFLKKLYGSGYTLHITMETDNNKPTLTSNKMEDDEREREMEEASTLSISKKRSKSKRKSAAKLQSSRPTSPHSSKTDQGYVASNPVMTLIRRHIKTAQLKSDSTHHADELEITMSPTSEPNLNASLATLFSDIDAKKASLKIKHLGLTYTTMEDVFTRVGEMAEAEAEGKSSKKKTKVDPEPTSIGKNQVERLTGSGLARRQFCALLVKRCQLGVRKWILLLFQIIFPVATMILALYAFEKLYSTAVKDLTFIFGPLLFPGLSLIVASIILIPIDEKLTKAKQLQFMTGISPFAYWASFFVWDFGLFTLISCLMTLCIPCVSPQSVLLKDGFPVAFLLALLVYGFGTIIMSYLFSLIMRGRASGFILMLIQHLIMGGFFGLFVEAMASDPDLKVMVVVSGILSIFPAFAAITSIVRLNALVVYNTDRCSEKVINSQRTSQLCTQLSKNLTKPDRYERKDKYLCCANCKQLIQNQDSFCYKKQSSLIQFSHPEVPDAQAGVLPIILTQMLIAIIFLVILLLVDYGVCNRICRKRSKIVQKSDQNDVKEDTDVHEERIRINNLVNSEQMYQDAIVVDGFSKYFGTFKAVSKVTFGVEPGMCFGLLGVNGAGKTTLFRMLTMDTMASDGVAYMGDKKCSSTSDSRRFLAGLGYCPQFDGFNGELTGKQMLTLYCRLRGVIVADGIKAEVQRWLVKLGLEDSGNVQCRKYSGGMKRRLSFGMAAIGQPPVLMLDEPSSGVDPMGKRQFQKILSSSTKKFGQAIIITSHNMEECEALCSKLCIMVNGSMQCFGSVEHLKNKFAQGYCLTLKVKGGKETEERKAVVNLIAEAFKMFKLLDENESIMQFQLLNKELSWKDVFSIMETMKGGRGSDFIEDYFVTETSLEQIFLYFARNQYPEREIRTSCCKSFWTCKCCKDK